MRLQAWAPAGGGKCRPSPPPPSKKDFWLYWESFCYFFFIYGGLFATFSHFWGPFHHGGPFYFMVGVFFGLAPAPPKKISVGARDCKEGSKACSPEIFLCNCNLVSSGHALLRFCQKNGKNNDTL